MSAVCSSDGVNDRTKAFREPPVLIWSACGGGVRDIIPNTILAEIEKRTRHSVSDIFDQMGGSSASAFLMLAAVAPDSAGKDPTKPRWPVATLLDEFPATMAKIFSTSGMFPNARHAFSRKYDPGPRNAVFDHYLGTTLLKDALTHVAVTAVDRAQETHIFTKARAENIPWHQKLTMAEVLQAATAAPTYMPPTTLTVADGRSVELLDGGMAANNPALLTYAEAAKLFGRQRPCSIISVGTGFLSPDYLSPDDLTRKGWLNAGGRLVEFMSKADVRAIDIGMEGLLGPSSYLSVNVEIQPTNLALDNADPANIRQMREGAEQWIEDHHDDLRDWCQMAERKLQSNC